MNTSIKAIETKYKGYRFRSRLEARWAVFFDALGLRWEYEKEGFDLGKAGWYLPDFWLPELNCWVEIKPREWNDGQDFWWASGATEKKASAIARSSSPVFVVSGEPWPDEYKCCVFYNEEGADAPMYFAECLQCGKFGITYGGWTGYVRCDCTWNTLDKPSHKEDGTETPRLLAAYEAARSARFEHGESPDKK